MDNMPHARGGVITYRDFIRIMEEEGYIISKFPVSIRNPHIKTFPIKKGTIGKIIEFTQEEIKDGVKMYRAI